MIIYVRLKCKGKNYAVCGFFRLLLFIIIILLFFYKKNYT